MLLDLVRSSGDHVGMGSLVSLIEADEADRSIPVAFQGHRHRALGLSACDRMDEDAAIDHLRTAVKHYDSWNAVPLAARARGELGAVLVRSATPEGRAEGTRLIEDARQTLIALRASTWLDALESVLDSVSTDRA